MESCWKIYTRTSSFDGVGFSSLTFVGSGPYCVHTMYTGDSLIFGQTGSVLNHYKEVSASSMARQPRCSELDFASGWGGLAAGKNKVSGAEVEEDMLLI